MNIFKLNWAFQFFSSLAKSKGGIKNHFIILVTRAGTTFPAETPWLCFPYPFNRTTTLIFPLRNKNFKNDEVRICPSPNCFFLTVRCLGE